MYTNMWTNVPKEFQEYADYSWDEHFGRPVPSYINREDFKGYIVARAKKSNVKRFIKFNTVVRYVAEDDQSRFSVTVEDLLTGKNRTEVFDSVVVGTGHFSVPNMPHFDGLEEFPGRIIHSHDLRNVKEFAGQDVLVIGNYMSGVDIGVQLHLGGSKSVTISYRTKAMAFQWPDGMTEVPLLIKIDGKTATFKDGTQREIDSIIFCTGYQHNFPFLEDKLRLVTANLFYPSQLYKGIFFQDQPRLLYLAMQNLCFTSLLFDAQARYARDVIFGRIPLPDVEKRREDETIWKEKLAQCKELIDLVELQANYIGDLNAATDHPPVKLEALLEIAKTCIADKVDSILNYRDKCFRSVFTGTEAARNPVPWVELGRK